MASKLPALKEDQLRPKQQVVFVPPHAKDNLGHVDVRFGFITSVAPSGLNVYCRFWQPDTLHQFQQGQDVSMTKMLLASGTSEGRLQILLHPHRAVDDRVVEYVYTVIYYDSLRIASKFMEFCANVFETPLTSSTIAGVRGEWKATTWQDLPGSIRISFMPTHGWEISSLVGSGYWKKPQYDAFLYELLDRLGEPPTPDAYLMLLKRLRDEPDQEIVELVHHLFKFQPIND